MSDHIGDANEMVDNLTLTAPERIYLWSEHTEGRDETFMGGNWSTLTHDDHESVEYVRADLVPFHALLEAMDEEALKARVAFLEAVAWQAFSVDQEIPECYVELKQWIEERNEASKKSLESVRTKL